MLCFLGSLNNRIGFSFEDICLLEDWKSKSDNHQYTAWNQHTVSPENRLSQEEMNHLPTIIFIRGQTPRFRESSFCWRTGNLNNNQQWGHEAVISQPDNDIFVGEQGTSKSEKPTVWSLYTHHKDYRITY